MGATKKAMEICLMREYTDIHFSARFANVAFSNGSLLDGFKYRLIKGSLFLYQILKDFITEEEAGQIFYFQHYLAKVMSIVSQ